MRAFLKLFSFQFIFLIALVAIVGITTRFKLDDRFGMFSVGIIFALKGIGHILRSREEGSVHKWAGVFFIIFAFFMIIVTTIMFIQGEHVISN